MRIFSCHYIHPQLFGRNVDNLKTYFSSSILSTERKANSVYFLRICKLKSLFKFAGVWSKMFGKVWRTIIDVPDALFALIKYFVWLFCGTTLVFCAFCRVLKKRFSTNSNFCIDHSISVMMPDEITFSSLAAGFQGTAFR